MRDRAGHRYDASSEEGQVPFDAPLKAGEAILTSRTFAVPTHAVGLGVVVAREGGLGVPGGCIIGEGRFHKPPSVYPEQPANGPTGGWIAPPPALCQFHLLPCHQSCSAVM